MTAGGKVHYAASGQIAVWIDDGGSIHLKTCEPHGDPVELAEHEAIELADLLKTLVKELEA